MGSRPIKGQKTEGSGRKPGTPNKKTQDLFRICEERGLNVFESMVELALEAVDEVKFNRLREIAQYLYPKRKAIEHSIDEENGFKILIEDYRKK